MAAPTAMIELYRTLALEGMRRLLARLDRRPWSPTFGCFDREYWHYKTLLEFPRADFQQCLWALALLYKTPFAGNELAARPVVRQWLRGGLEFWRRMRNADGSLNEWYQNERSFCSTAFTAAAVGETLLLLGEELDAPLRSALVGSLEKTVGWLIRHQNLRVANQMAAGLLALDCLRRLTGQESHAAAYREWKAALLRLQHSEGWFSEYGGADLGYGLLTLDLLAHLAQRTGEPDLSGSAAQLLAFLACFVAPDGTVGGDYSSRHTVHCFPYGLEALAAAGSPVAWRVVPGVRSALRHNRVPTPLTADDTYAAYFYVNSFCLAACSRGLAEAPPGPEPPPAERLQSFPGAGLLVYSTAACHVVIDTRHGAWRMVDRQGNSAGDSGYVAIARGGRRLSSQCGRGEAVARISADGARTTVEVAVRFGVLDTSLPLARYAVLFKAFTRYVLRVPLLANWFGRALKRAKV
ncbi:MAG: hypothetical protein HY330_04690, partial [Chloroflexi bacterium]|nr:hypothetical protein [Chloroflexota bacterium]